MSHSCTEQPTPKGDGDRVYEYVVQDIFDRVKKGLSTYGTPLKTHNGRNALVDLYQELIDAVFYVKQVLLELEDTDVWYKNAYDYMLNCYYTVQEENEKLNLKIQSLEKELNK